MTRVMAAAGLPREDVTVSPVTFEEMRPGCYDPVARLADMDEAGIEASLNFPTFPRFAGQAFSEAQDKELGFACIQAYNDWMVEEWCADPRLVPIILVPFWDPAAGRRRGAAQRRTGRAGHHASREIPAYLGWPSIHDEDRYWDPLFAACAETGHGGVHAHRLGLADAVHVARRPARRPVDGHLHQLHALDVRLAVQRACSSGSPT